MAGVVGCTDMTPQQQGTMSGAAIGAAGGAGILKKLAATMIDFNPRFEIMPGTKLTEPKPTGGDAFEAEVGAPMAE